MKEIYIREYLEKLGLSKDETSIFLHLINHGPRTITQLVNESKLSHYAISQSLSHLAKLSLVDKKDKNKSSIYVVRRIDSLAGILEEKKDVLKKRALVVEKTIDTLSKVYSRVEKDSKIVHYSGIAGLKQIMWNSQKAEQEIRLFEVAELSPYLDFGFYDSVRAEYVKNNIKYRELTNEKAVKGWTDVTEFLGLWDIRYIDSSIIDMSVELMIYNNVYCLYGVTQRGIWGVEIYNTKLSEMQKKVFDFMWNHGKNMTVIDSTGSCVVE
ncbi:MarR family transcriptional regulator [Candidatus Dojkabacteria bacterium]|nr:MarR family transcriptional regulator [Candidatus Dojkabacteria bacterium]